MDLDWQVGCRHEYTLYRIEPVHRPIELRRETVVEPQNLWYSHRYSSGYLVVLVRDAIVVVIPVAGLNTVGAVVGGPALLKVIPVQISAVVGVVVLVSRVGAGIGIRRIGYARTVTEVVVVPRVRRLTTKPRWPQHDFVLVKHAIGVVVEVDVVSQAIVVVVPRGNPRCGRSQLESVDQSIAIPVVVRPVKNSIIVVVPR